MKKIIKATTSLWVVAGVLGLATFVHLYDRAFPEAAIQFAKSRGEILGQAKRFLEAQRPSLEGYSESLIFTNDAQARIFLERTLGLTEANALTRTRVKVWAWQGRWFRPLHKEEYQVSIAPDGELIGYTHLVEEATPGTYLEADAAQALAVQWLAEHLGLDISGYQLIDEDYTERPHRSDHTFVWEEPGFNVQGATYRTRVTVAGDQVVEFSKFLKVPERWIQQYTQEQSKGYVTTVLLTGGYGLLGIAVLWVFLGALKRQLPKWRLAACVAGGLAMVQISSTLNAWPLAKHGLQTTQGMGSAYVWLVTQAILTGLTTALQVGITAIAGWFLAQQVWGKGPAAQLIPAFTRQGTRSLLQSTVVGYGLAGVHLAYVSVFYLASFRWGAWAPSDTTQYQNSFATWLPWLFPLTVGLSASLNEEFTFRLFGVTLCQRFTRRRWLAVLLPGLLWAFLHSAYPQHPFYIRGVELILPAIASGWIFLHYGILSTIVWHYAYDAFLVALPLLRSSSPYFTMSGWLVVTALAILPFGIWLLMWGRQRMHLKRPLIRERGMVKGIPAFLRARVERFFEPARALRIAPTWIVLTALGIFGLTTELLHLQSMWSERQTGSRLDVSVTRLWALKATRQVLETRGVHLQGWYPAIHVDTEDWEWEMRYLAPRMGHQAARSFLRQELPESRWHVEWLKPGVRESYDVWLRLDGTFDDISHTLPEETPGKTLPAATARYMAREILRDYKGLDLSKWRLVDTTSETLPQRSDHTFTWERRGQQDAEASLRVDVTISGAEWTGFSKYLHLPEAWVRQQEVQRLRQTVAWSLSVCLVALLCLALGWRMIRYLRRGQLRWRTGMVVASVISVGFLVSRVNEWPNFFQGYSAALSLFGFAAVKGMSWLRDAVGLFVLILALGAFVEVLFPEVFPQQEGLHAQIRRLRQGLVSLPEWLASGWCVIALALTMLGISEGYHWFAQHLVPEACCSLGGALSEGVTPRIASACPALGIVLNKVILTVGGVLAWMLLISILTLSQRRWPRGTILMGGGMLLINALTSGTWVEVWLSLGTGMAVVYAVWVGSQLLVGRNVGLVAAWVMALLTLKEALPLLGYHHPVYVFHGTMALLAGFAPCVWVGFRALRLSHRFPHIRYAAAKAPRTNRTPLTNIAS